MSKTNVPFVCVLFFVGYLAESVYRPNVGVSNSGFQCFSVWVQSCFPFVVSNALFQNLAANLPPIQPRWLLFSSMAQLGWLIYILPARLGWFVRVTNMALLAQMTISMTCDWHINDINKFVSMFLKIVVFHLTHPYWDIHILGWPVGVNPLYLMSKCRTGITT